MRDRRKILKTRLARMVGAFNTSIVYIDQPVGVGFSYGDVEDDDHDEQGCFGYVPFSA